MKAINILVFKTNIRFKKDLKIIAPCLQTFKSVVRWNIDWKDADRILRIESAYGDPVEIIKTINMAGYHCEELPD
ncbi:MAG: hypothetical protein JWP81_1805 [Ferruginibacter sp.]|nr:hypothetical protein [Ferruginibacter sp.]